MVVYTTKNVASVARTIVASNCVVAHCKKKKTCNGHHAYLGVKVRLEQILEIASDPVAE